MLQAQPVIHTPDRPRRAPKIAEFSLAVQRRRIDNDMIMDMVLVYVGADNKSMIALCQFQSKLLPDPVRFFRRNLPWFKCLPEMIGDHIVCASVPAGHVQILTFRKKKLHIRSPGITLVTADQFPKISFLWVLCVINDVRDRCGNIPALTDM